jgi:hypothetical protein
MPVESPLSPIISSSLRPDGEDNAPERLAAAQKNRGFFEQQPIVINNLCFWASLRLHFIMMKWLCVV